MTVERLMGMVRRINEAGTTVILVEQSLNRALSLADRCFFMERGEIRFDGPTADLMARDDLLRPVFLGAASTGLELGRPMLAFSVPEFRSRPRRLLRPRVRAAGPRAGPGVPHQPGAQLRPGPDRRHRRRVPGQAHRGLQVQLLVRPGALGRAGRLRRCHRRAGAAALVQPPPRARDGGHHRPELRAAGPDRPAVHRAAQPLRSPFRFPSISPSRSGRSSSPRPRCSPSSSLRW